MWTISQNNAKCALTHRSVSMWSDQRPPSGPNDSETQTHRVPLGWEVRRLQETETSPGAYDTAPGSGAGGWISVHIGRTGPVTSWHWIGTEVSGNINPLRAKKKKKKEKKVLSVTNVIFRGELCVLVCHILSDLCTEIKTYWLLDVGRILFPGLNQSPVHEPPSQPRGKLWAIYQSRFRLHLETPSCGGEKTRRIYILISFTRTFLSNTHTHTHTHKWGNR